MGEVVMSARDEYQVARIELARLRDNHTRAAVRGDRAITLAYSQRIAGHLAMMARIERRIIREKGIDEMSKVIEIQQQMRALELQRSILSDQQSVIEKQIAELQHEFHTLLVAEAIAAENWHDVLYYYRTHFKRMDITTFTTLADAGYNFGQTPLQFDGITITYNDEQHDTRYAVPDLLGFTITRIQRVDNEEIIFTRSDGPRVSMYHGQDCCEVVEIESIVGDLDALIGKPLIIAEVATSYSEDAHGDEQWTFYRLGTDIGNIVTIRWHGGSNGYYSTSVHFKFV